ncbi:MAG: methyltransferase domain-containing protein [Lachnospiraceae bacterium]|nr:methyltransferase domain-containing protein [Lachnospiraceae bacterium]
MWSRIVSMTPEVFDSITNHIRKQLCLIQNVLNRAMYNHATALVILKQGERVLDIGYGNGYLLHKMYRKQEVELYGIDISDDARKMATKKNWKAAKEK